MYDVPSERARPFKWTASLACFIVMAFPITQARADNPLGLYVGGAVGQARVDTSAPAPYVSDFRENHSAFKAMAGLRPISPVGAELAYVDFGHPSRLNGIILTDVTMNGAAALGILYLPVSIVDVYVKAGLARLQSTVTSAIVCPPGAACIAIAAPAPVSRTNVGFGGGAGAQLKVGSFAVRGEYERFNAAGGNPDLFSLGLTWTFQ
jgi:opacity protein-like surface antigen